MKNNAYVPYHTSYKLCLKICWWNCNLSLKGCRTWLFTNQVSVKVTTDYCTNVLLFLSTLPSKQKISRLGENVGMVLWRAPALVWKLSTALRHCCLPLTRPRNESTCVSLQLVQLQPKRFSQHFSCDFPTAYSFRLVSQRMLALCLRLLVAVGKVRLPQEFLEAPSVPLAES